MLRAVQGRVETSRRPRPSACLKPGLLIPLSLEAGLGTQGLLEVKCLPSQYHVTRCLHSLPSHTELKNSLAQHH